MRKPYMAFRSSAFRQRKGRKDEKIYRFRVRPLDCEGGPMHGAGTAHRGGVRDGQGDFPAAPGGGKASAEGADT